YPAVRLGMRAGTCAGLVASETDGLIFPRSILQIPGDSKFVVADMVGWGSPGGKLLLLDPAQPPGHRIRELIGGLDQPFGLVRGPDNKVYASTAEAIFRFDPLAAEPKATIETIVRGLPGNRVTLSDGTVIHEAAHPLKAFVFDKTGKLYVNIGAPTDNCLPSNATKPCAAGEGTSPMAAIWAFTPPAGGIFPALKPGDANPRREIFARGLRNSMALAMHPDFPDAGFAFLQAENGRDLPDIFQPNEEINALEKGKHYGWPYCYDLATTSPEFKAFLRTASPYRNLCGNAALYRAPLSLLPPHAAPLGMLYYHGEKFAGLKGKLIIGLHGYRPTGGRILVYDVDDKGFPNISPPPVHYNVSCAAEPVRTFQTGSAHQVAAAAYTELVSGWYRVNGVRPQGAPVGMTVASDGAIWVVEDKNRTALRIDTTTTPAPPRLPCGNRSARQIAELRGFVEASATNRGRLTQIRAKLVEKHCMGCHSDFGVKPDQTGAEKDAAVLNFLLSQDGWLYPGDPDASRWHIRLRGIGSEKLMPPGGEGLIKNEPGYKQLLATVDQFIATMVPGTRMRIRPGPVERAFRNEGGHVCGALPAKAVVIVTARSPREKPDFSRIYRPADIYLNGECSDDGGYYIEQGNVVPL
ncbi:MAG: PQQ-dependent sugar dehydrogenase, partial [Proteobacteria bacterium]|nr:PQQ-dependent sugar dehydrogenase [Pseudomonadota bacterium]